MTTRAINTVIVWLGARGLLPLARAHRLITMFGLGGA